MSTGKLIRIHLDDGSVSGVRHAEIVNWTGQAISSPRLKVKSLKSREESQKPGVYFLFGVDEKSGEDALYIGETENVYNRLQEHLAQKDFWNEVVFFTSKDENLTKAHVKYLEARLVQLATVSARYVILNGNEPQQPALPRGDRDAMDEFVLNLKILLGAVGYKALESIIEPKPIEPKELPNTEIVEPTIEALPLFLKVKGIDAKAHVTDEGIVVLAASQASIEAQRSLSAGAKKLREQLIQNGVLMKSSSSYVFTKNYLFKSPSQAATVIAGSETNGRKHWKTSNGVSLKSIEEPDEKPSNK